MKNSWKCDQCGYILQADSALEKCPSCQINCTFINITCYIPECGGAESGNIDPQLAKNRKPEKLG